MVNFFRQLSPTHKLLFGLIGLVILAGAGWFAWWTISPLFINVRVNEQLPASTAKEGAATITVLSQGKFVGADNVIHHAEGTAKLVRTSPAEVIIRFEDDFKASNGPDLYVWLTKDGDVKNGYVDLGKLKGNLGSQNYIIPTGTDLTQYKSVIIWCKAFSVLFGSAKLEPQP